MSRFKTDTYHDCTPGILSQCLSDLVEERYNAAYPLAPRLWSTRSTTLLWYFRGSEELITQLLLDVMEAFDIKIPAVLKPRIIIGWDLYYVTRQCLLAKWARAIIGTLSANNVVFVLHDGCRLTQRDCDQSLPPITTNNLYFEMP